LGVKFYACAGNLELFGLSASELIPELRRQRSATAYLIDRVDE